MFIRNSVVGRFCPGSALLDRVAVSCKSCPENCGRRSDNNNQIIDNGFAKNKRTVFVKTSNRDSWEPWKPQGLKPTVNPQILGFL